MKKVNFVRSINRTTQQQVRRWYRYSFLLMLLVVIAIGALQTQQLFELFQTKALHTELAIKAHPLTRYANKQQTLHKNKEQLVQHIHTIKQWKTAKNPSTEITELVHALETNNAHLVSCNRTAKKCEITINIDDPTTLNAIIHSIKTLSFIKDIQLSSLTHHNNQIEIKLDGSTKEA